MLNHARVEDGGDVQVLLACPAPGGGGGDAVAPQLHDAGARAFVNSLQPPLQRIADHNRAGAPQQATSVHRNQ